MPTIPEWLKAPDLAGEYARGVQIGGNLAAEQQRLDAENRRIEMQQIERRERLAQLGAYRQVQLQLRQTALENAAQMNQQRTRDAALRLADQQGFAADLQGGMSIDQALYRHPRLATPTAAVAAHKDSLDLGEKRLDLAKQRLDDQSSARQSALDLQGQRNDLERQRITDLENKPGKIGTLDIPVTKDAHGNPDPLGPMAHGIPLDSPLINQIMGTNAPAGTGTNFTRTATAPLTAAAAAPAAPVFAPAPALGKRTAGTVYSTPKGPHVWTGTNWMVYQPDDDNARDTDNSGAQ